MTTPDDIQTAFVLGWYCEIPDRRVAEVTVRIRPRNCRY